MFSRYPDCAAHRKHVRNELVNRFCDCKNPGHNSAFWELLLHEAFLRLGYHVEIHPAIVGTDDRPDFRITNADGQSLIVEAVCQMAELESDQSANKRLADVYNALNTFQNHADWQFMVNYRGTPTRQVATNALLKGLSHWLNDYQPAPERNYIGDDEDQNVFVFRQDEWELHVRPIAVESLQRSSPRRVASWGSKDAHFVNAFNMARKKIDRKAGRYGKPPMVVAVNLLEPFMDNQDIATLLYGPIHAHFCRAETGKEWTEAYRGSDGLFVRRQKPINQNLVGVLVSNCNPWDVHRRSISFHLHPFGPQGQAGLTGVLAAFDRLPRSIINDKTEVEHVNGNDLRTILGLPIEWPDCACCPRP